MVIWNAAVTLIAILYISRTSIHNFTQLRSNIPVLVYFLYNAHTGFGYMKEESCKLSIHDTDATTVNGLTGVPLLPCGWLSMCIGLVRSVDNEFEETGGLQSRGTYLAKFLNYTCLTNSSISYTIWNKSTSDKCYFHADSFNTYHLCSYFQKLSTVEYGGECLVM